MITRYALSGAIGFVHESPTRYAHCTSSGDMPALPSIGTRIGARNAHFALALDTARFRTATTTTIAPSMGPWPKPSDLMSSPPSTPRMMARFDCLNHAIACPAKKASTR